MRSIGGEGARPSAQNESFTKVTLSIIRSDSHPVGALAHRLSRAFLRDEVSLWDSNLPLETATFESHSSIRDTDHPADQRFWAMGGHETVTIRDRPSTRDTSLYATAEKEHSRSSPSRTLVSNEAGTGMAASRRYRGGRTHRRDHGRSLCSSRRG